MNARIQAPSRPVIVRAGFLGVLALLIGIAVLVTTPDFSSDTESSSTAGQGIGREGSLELRSRSEAERPADPEAAARAGAAAQLRGRAEIQRQLSSSVLAVNGAFSGQPQDLSNEPATDGRVGRRIETSDSPSHALRRPE